MVAVEGQESYPCAKKLLQTPEADPTPRGGRSLDRYVFRGLCDSILGFQDGTVRQAVRGESLAVEIYSEANVHALNIQTDPYYLCDFRW